MDLSRNKCASNVIEKCLATGNQEEVGQWVDTLCAKQDKLAELMKDQFGNYVCFTAFLARLSSVLAYRKDKRMKEKQNCLRKTTHASGLVKPQSALKTLFVLFLAYEQHIGKTI